MERASFIVEEGEVLPLQVRNGSSALRRDGHIESDLTRGRLNCSGGLLGEGAGGGGREARRMKAKRRLIDTVPFRSLIRVSYALRAEWVGLNGEAQPSKPGGRKV
jgi:hypothetical protein